LTGDGDLSRLDKGFESREVNMSEAQCSTSARL
jgi:hypothetical protein